MWEHRTQSVLGRKRTPTCGSPHPGAFKLLLHCLILPFNSPSGAIMGKHNGQELPTGWTPNEPVRTGNFHGSRGHQTGLEPWRQCCSTWRRAADPAGFHLALEDRQGELPARSWLVAQEKHRSPRVLGVQLSF